MNKSIVFVISLVACTGVLAQGPAVAAAPESAASRLGGNKPDKAQLTSNLDSVAKLLEGSSAARQIE